MSPQHRFYDVSVSMEFEDDKGKIKKQVVKYLVDAADTNMAEKNTIELLSDSICDWEIIGINLSKVKEVFICED